MGDVFDLAHRIALSKSRRKNASSGLSGVVLAANRFGTRCRALSMYACGTTAPVVLEGNQYGESGIVVGTRQSSMRGWNHDSSGAGRCQCHSNTRWVWLAMYTSHGICPTRSFHPPQIPKHVRTNSDGASGWVNNSDPGYSARCWRCHSTYSRIHDGVPCSAVDTSSPSVSTGTPSPKYSFVDPSARSKDAAVSRSFPLS